LAIKINKEIREVISLISNIFEAYTTAFYIFDSSENLLELSYHYSLSNNIKENFSLNIGKNLKIWLMNLKKPVTLTDESSCDYAELLQIYKKQENIKCFFAVPVGNFRGIIYIDTKRSYAFPEKEQKLLKHCSNIMELLFRIEDSARNIKEFIDYSELAKRIKLQIASGNTDVNSMESVIEKIANILQFEYGVLVINDFSEKFKFASTNNYNLGMLSGRTFSFKDSVVGTFLGKKIKNIKYVATGISEHLHFFTKIERFDKNRIKNYLYFPFYTGASVMGAFVFFNFKKEYNFNKLCHYLYDILYPVVYENTVRESLNSIVTKEPVTGFTRDYYFFKKLETSSLGDKGLIFVRNKKMYSFLKKHSLPSLLQIYKKLKNNLEKILNNDIEGVLISLDKIAFLVTINDMREFLLKKNIILKTFQSRLFNIDNQEITVELDIEIFENLSKSKSEVLKISYK
jgi:hypothetical protein